MEVVKHFVEELKHIGIDMVMLLAGFSGGFASIVKKKGFKWCEKVAIIGAGGLSANYVTPVLGELLNMSKETYLGLAFFVGYGGLILVESLFKQIHKKATNNDSDTISE